MTSWDLFFQEKIKQILSEKKTVVDIGGGLRISSKRGNRYDKSRAWIRPFLERVEYKILDPVSDYNPDIIGDIHSLPFKNNSQDAILCISVLEHVENPIQAVDELFRILKPGGYCFIYIPFLYYYHAEHGYYRDYWRFTKDGVEMLLKKFSHMEMQNVRGAVETWCRLSPLGRTRFFLLLARLVDRAFGKANSDQVSGYYIFLVK